MPQVINIYCCFSTQPWFEFGTDGFHFFLMENLNQPYLVLSVKLEKICRHDAIETHRPLRQWISSLTLRSVGGRNKVDELGISNKYRSLYLLIPHSIIHCANMDISLGDLCPFNFRQIGISIFINLSSKQVCRRLYGIPKQLSQLAIECAIHFLKKARSKDHTLPTIGTEQNKRCCYGLHLR